jgi:hypothetical protein
MDSAGAGGTDARRGRRETDTSRTEAGDPGAQVAENLPRQARRWLQPLAVVEKE